MSATVYKQFFGDAEHTFRLTPLVMIELERKTGAAIGELFARIFNKTFAAGDLAELIRFALIGSGIAPKRADELIRTYAIDRPLIETYPLAVAIAEATWFGQPNEQK